MKRIEDFLAEEDVPEWVCGIEGPDRMAISAGQVNFRDNARFAWSAKAESFSVGPLSLELPVGKLTLVTGPTGSGKSTFLGAILGGMNFLDLFDSLQVRYLMFSFFSFLHFFFRGRLR